MTELERPPAQAASSRGLLIGVALLLVPLSLWGANLLVQRVRVRSAIRACERELIPSAKVEVPPTLPQERIRVIAAAGCRAVPLILDAAEETQNEQFARGCSALLMNLVRAGGRQNDPRAGRLCGPAYNIRYPDRRARGMAGAQDWWRAHLAEHHPWWKVWTWSCLTD